MRPPQAQPAGGWNNDFAFICASRRNDAVHIQRTQRVGVVEREVGDWDGRDRRRG